ncbi:hypothetical protein ACWFRJ_41790 [Streptomyces sp. NPDC055239]
MTRPDGTAARVLHQNASQRRTAWPLRMNTVNSYVEHRTLDPATDVNAPVRRERQEGEGEAEGEGEG